ncbi:hypothetical protein cyc_07019 [Cyclospora cayetanensis]|uniref:Uncharacterized protein n=1 Tax=Cyclospora cayetanensis TaxID=88456 RepID=A0A1D3DA61_9EIME|nr:hypothetical protein cyc_07019 [Cyclospora cayetanensis]
MTAQFLVSFSATSSAPDATGFIELHTEKGAFAIPIIARKEPPVLLSLPRVLHFGAVRPGESTCRELTIHHKGGNAALRTFIVPAKPAPCCQHAEDPSPLLKASKAAEQADCISFLLNHGRRKDEDTFMVAEREVLLLQGRKDPSLSIRFSPREPGLFRATLLLILSERKVSAEARPEPLGVVELQGIADAAALTLKEFCGTQLPMELLTPLVDQQIPQGHTLLGGAGTQTPALACDNAAGIGLAAGAITRPAGALQEDELRQLQESYETALCLTAKETLFPQVVDFGYTLPQGPRIVQTLTLCNEGALPIRLAWHHDTTTISEHLTSTDLFATAPEPPFITSLSEAFSVSPKEVFLQAKESCSFRLVADPRLLPRTLSDSPESNGMEDRIDSFCCWVSLRMMGVLKCALLSPLVYLKGLSAPSCPCLNAKEINMQRDTNDSMAAPPLRWMPLLATPKKICRQPNGTSCTQAVETSQAAEAEQREWEMLRFQMRLKIDRPRVVLLGPLPEGTAPYVARLRPGVVQSIALRARNEGRSKVRLAVRRDVRGLKARWRIPYACCGSSSSGKPPGEDPKTAWLLRVDEEQLEALQREQDLASVVGLGPQPFGYFCISPKGGTPLCPGAEEALILRVLPLCCGSFSASVAISVLPPASEDSAEPDEAELVEQARLSYPVSVEVAVPRVSASWPPVLDFGTVRAHSRTTRALLLYNPAPAPAIARIRILSSETTADAATAQGATLEMQSMAGEFPCHFGSCLLRGPSAGAFAPPATAVCEPSTEKGTESADPTCSVGEAAPLANPKVLPGKEEPETSRLRSCIQCLCVDESLQTAEPFLSHAEKAAEEAAADFAAALHAETARAGGGEEVQQQQQNVLLHHLKAWKQQQTLQQGLRKPLAAVIGMSGRVIAYPGHVVLPPGGHGVFLLILRASHPQEIDSHIFVETLEGGQPVVVSIRAKVTLPKLRLSSHLLELPRLFLRQPMMLKKQLTVYNDSDIPTKIRWTSLAPMHHKEQEQDQLRHSACGEGPHSCQSDQGGLLVSLSPAESILRERSSVNVDICCVGLCAGTRLETKAFCKGDSLLVPLQVSLAGACSGVSVTYALFTQHQLVAAACLLQQRTRQNKSQERSSTHPDAAVEQHTHIKQEHKQTPFENRQQRKSPSCVSNVTNNGSRSSACRMHNSASCKGRHGKQHSDLAARKGSCNIARIRSINRDIECTSASEELDWGVEAVEVLQASGIGTWGALECGVSNSRGNSEGSQELALPKLHAGGDSAFVYLLAINNSPIPGALQVEAFTGQAPQQSLQKRQLHASAIRHPSLYEEGRPVGASMCPDCSGANAEWSCSNSRSLVLGTARRSSCSSTPTTNSLNSANSIEIGYASSLTAEALLIQAASFKAPSELKQLLPHTSAAQSLAFKTKSGVYTLQAAAGRQRRQQLLRMTEDGVLIIPHPETPCELQQHQAVLLAIEIFGAVPADYEGMLRLGLAPSEHLQLPLKDPQWAQEQCQVLIPVKIPVCGSLLLLPPLQKSIRYRECEPPLITAQISLQQPLIAAQLQKEQTALQRSGEAALKATEAATAAADAGIEEGSRGWEVLAGIVAEAMASTTSHMANEEHAPKEDQHQEIEPPLKPMEERPEQEAASAPRSAPKMAMEIETALRAEITAPEGATHQSAAAMPSKAKDAAISLNNRAEGVAPTPHAAPATKTQIDTELLPPQEYFVREWMPLSAEARGIAAASVVLRTHRASVPAGQTPHDAAVPKANVIKHADSPAAATYEQVEDEFAEPEPLRQGRTAAANDGLRVVTEGFVSGPEEESSSSRRSNLGSNSGNRRKKPEQFSEREGPSALGPIRGDRAETLLTEVIPPLSCAPRIEPCKAILAPFESLEVSLHCGLLLAATGVHRLRAIAHAVPLAAGKAFAAHDASPAAECPSGQTTPVGSSTQVTTHETESQRQQQQTMQHGFASRTESGKGQAVVGCTSSAVDKQKEKTFRNTTSAFPLVWPYSQQPLYTASDAKLHSVEQQRTGTMPGPHVATSATRTGAGPTPITALTATQRSDAEPLIVDFCIETKPPCFRLSSKGESHGEAAATEGTVTPPKGTARLGTVWFTASPVTNGSNGQKADVSEGLVLREVLLEPLPYCNSIRCGMFTIKKGQQLRLVVGFLPPTICELTRESKTNCTGKISIFLPGVSPLSSTQTNSPHGPFPVCPTLTEEQAAIEEPLCHTLLSGILRVLRPNEDPRPLLSLGLAALQQYHYQQAPPLEAAKALQQVQQQVLVQGLNTAWPTVPAAAAAAILEGGASSSQKAFGVSAALQASDQSAAAEAGPPEYTQTIALVGICRQSLILMWCPPDEGEKETHREEKRGSWAAHCVPSDPLVINFSTTHVQARKYPAKLLHLRAVSGTPSRWQVEECQSSEKPDAAPATMPVHMKETQDGQTSSFKFSFTTGTLGSRTGAEEGRNEATIIICFTPAHAGHHKSLFRISADLAAAPQYVELRGYATTDETFDVCASLGNLAEPPYQCIP